MFSKFPFFLHGGDYNPDQWRHVPGTVDEDFRLFKLAGINSVSVGIFSWAAIEPREGEYNFGWLDGIMARCARDGIVVVLATPSGAKPNWMAQKYPEIRRQTSYGWCVEPQQDLQAGRHNHCLTSPVYRAKVAEIDRKLAERYGHHPALALWHISNEFGGECRCPHCMQAFREWLQKKYVTLEAMNHAWWTGFWSHEFSDWNQIVAIDTTVDGLVLDWKRFVSDTTASFLKNEADALKSVNPDIPVTTNFMGFYEPLDYNRLAKYIDVASWDNYPPYHDRPGMADHSAAMRSLMHDLCRSFKKAPFLMMESSPGPVNWMTTNRLLRPGVHRLKSLQAVAHGSDSVQYFQIRKGRGGCEKFHGAVIDHVGDDSPRMFKEVAGVGKDLKSIQDVLGSATPAEVAFVHDWESRWALNNAQGPSETAKNVLETGLLSNYLPYWKRGVPVDIVSPEDDISKYKVVVAPICFMVQDGFAEKVAKFVEKGGTFVTTFLSGIVDKDVLVSRGGFPGPFKGICGIWAEETDYLYPDERNTVSFVADNSLGIKGKYEVGSICEVVHVLSSEFRVQSSESDKGRSKSEEVRSAANEDVKNYSLDSSAEILGTFGRDFYAGNPAVTVNNYGKGKAVYIAAHGGNDFYAAIHGALIEKLSLHRALTSNLPEGVTATIREKNGKEFIFVENFANEPRNVDLGPLPREDLLSGNSCTGRVELPAYGVLVLG